MKKMSPSPPDLATMSEAYKELLETVIHKVQHSREHLQKVIDNVRCDMVARGRLNEPDATHLGQFLQCDLAGAGHYLQKTGQELSAWLGFEETLLESTFWQLFSAAADQTTTELTDIKLQATYAEYHTGEITGLGTLLCDHCSETLHFHKPGHIPPCPQCHGTRFHRQHFS